MKTLTLEELLVGMREALADPMQDDEILYENARAVDVAELSEADAQLLTRYLTDPALTRED